MEIKDDDFSEEWYKSFGERYVAKQRWAVNEGFVDTYIECVTMDEWNIDEDHRIEIQPNGDLIFGNALYKRIKSPHPVVVALNKDLVKGFTGWAGLYLLALVLILIREAIIKLGKTRDILSECLKKIPPKVKALTAIFLFVLFLYWGGLFRF